MNIYLYPLYNNGYCTIKRIVAKNIDDCEEKIKSKYCDQYEDLDDLLDYDEFCDDLADKYNVYLGDIFEINEFS